VAKTACFSITFGGVRLAVASLGSYRGSFAAIVLKKTVILSQKSARHF